MSLRFCWQVGQRSRKKVFFRRETLNILQKNGKNSCGERVRSSIVGERAGLIFAKTVYSTTPCISTGMFDKRENRMEVRLLSSPSSFCFSFQVTIRIFPQWVQCICTMDSRQEEKGALLMFWLDALAFFRKTSRSVSKGLWSSQVDTWITFRDMIQPTERLPSSSDRESLDTPSIPCNMTELYTFTS